MWKSLAGLSVLMFTSGCVTVIPAHVQITDVASGKKFETYESEMYSKENMLGYNFYDVKTHEWVMLKAYSKKVLEPSKVVGNNSAEAYLYRQKLKAD